jgi:hypothetical protein
VNKQTRKTRSQEFFSASLPAFLRGVAVLLLFTHQAWADVICCGANEIESPQSCHQSHEEHGSGLRTIAEPGKHYTVAPAENAKPSVEACFTDQSQKVSWCCQFSLPAEPQRPITSASNQTPLNTAPAFFAAEAFVTSAQINVQSSPATRSRPIFLLTSCFII